MKQRLPRYKGPAALSCAVCILLCLGDPAGHGGAAGGGARRVVKGGGGGAYREFSFDRDTSMLAIDFFSQSAFGWAPTLHGADPLGTGGRPPEAVNRYLFQEGSIDFFNLGGLEKRNLQTNYGEFGFIPTWKPNQSFLRLQIKAFPEVWVSGAIDFIGEFNQFADQLETGHFDLSELQITWYPEAVPGFSFSAGKLYSSSGFNDLFGASLLENYSMSGVHLSYYREFGLFSDYRLDAFAGTNFNGYTILHRDQVLNQTATDLDGNHQGYYTTTRQQTHVYGQFMVRPLGVFYLRGIGGYQWAPGDSTDTRMGANDFVSTYKIEDLTGWHLGGDAGYFGGKTWEHTVAVAYGRDDVEMGWGGPAYVAQTRSDDLMSNQTYLSRKGSQLFNYLYWGKFDLESFRLDWGAWFMHHLPAKNPRREFDNNNLIYNEQLTILSTVDSDSILIKEGVITSDSISLASEKFRALKFSAQPYVLLWDRLGLGLRYDYIFYLDPDALRNTQEQLLDETFRNITHPQLPRFGLFGPSKMDLEAVNAHVVSPWAALLFGDAIRLEFNYSMGFYGKPVRRQGRIGDRHQNYTVSTTLFYQFRKESSGESSK